MTDSLLLFVGGDIGNDDDDYSQNSQTENGTHGEHLRGYGW